MNPLKPLVSNHQLWQGFSSYIDFLINEQYRVIEQASDDRVMWKTQGAITALRRLKKLKEEVDGRTK
jgi:hypothetical protein